MLWVFGSGLKKRNALGLRREKEEEREEGGDRRAEIGRGGGFGEMEDGDLERDGRDRRWLMEMWAEGE